MLAAGMGLNIPVLPGPVPSRHQTIHAASNRLLEDAVTGSYGDIIQDANSHYYGHDMVEVSFKAGSPRNDYMTDKSFVEVQRFINGNWVEFSNENHRDVTFIWERHVQIQNQVPGFVNSLVNMVVNWFTGLFGNNSGSGVNLNSGNSGTESTATVRWRIREDIPSGQYRIVHNGFYNPPGSSIKPYTGKTGFFDVYNPTQIIALENLEYGKFLSAEGNGGSDVNIEGAAIDSWEQFGLIREGQAQGGCVRSGDTVGLRTRGGKFVSSRALTDLNANPDLMRRRERHVIRFPSNNCLDDTDVVTLESWRGTLVSGEAQFTANPDGDVNSVTDEERFQVHDLAETQIFQISLRAPSGDYLTAPREGGSWLRLEPPQDGPNPDKTQKFNLIVYDHIQAPICDQARIGLMTNRKFYLQKNDGGLMTALGLNYTEPATFKLRLTSSTNNCLTPNSTFSGRAYIQTEDRNYVHNTPSTVFSLSAVFSNNPAENAFTEWEITTYP